MEISWVENVIGATSPWRVASELHLDALGLPRHFLLKNFRAGQERSRYVEYLASRLAAELDIGAPRPELLTITTEFISAHRLLPKGPSGIGEALVGPHMAVPWYNDATVLARLPYGKIHDLHSRKQPAGVLAADTLLQNTDRHRGNVLIRPSVQGKRMLVPIDWGLAFEGYEPIRSALRPIADRRQIYGGSADMRPNISGPQDFDLVRAQMTRLALSPVLMRSLVEDVPDEWNVPEKWTTAAYEHLMRRLEVTLDVLLHIGDDRSMPDWQLPLLGSGDR